MKMFDCGQDCRELVKLGMTAVWGGPDLGKIADCLQNGLAYDLACGAFGTDDARLFAVDVTGRSTGWFSSGCPNRPEIRDRALARIEELAQISGLHGLVIDGARFASPASPEGPAAFFTCFCPHCLAKARRIGYDADRMMAAVAMLYAAVFEKGGLSSAACIDGLRDWLRFRAFCTTEFLRAFHDTVKAVNPALQTGIFIFAPTLAPLVGQDYRSLTFLDSFMPMIYRHYRHPEGPACLDHEYRAIASYLAGASDAARPALAELAGAVGLKFPEDRSGFLFPPEAIGYETALARQSIGNRALCPIILLDDDRLAESVAATRRGGADDVGFFAYAQEHLHFLDKA